MAKNPWDFAKDDSDKWSFAATSEKDMDPVTHGLAVIGEKALHALPDALGFALDLGQDLVNPAYKHLPGTGPLADTVNKSYRKAEESRGEVPQARNKAEEYLGAASEGIAGGLLGGPQAAGLAALGGAAAGVTGQGTYDLTGNETLAYLAAMAAGTAPFAGHAIRGRVQAKRLANGAAHPDYARFVDEIIPDLEGGGTIEHPKTNPESGAFGPMQVTPETLRDPGYGIKPWDGTVQDSIRIGREKYAAMVSKYKGDHSKALAAYNWGEGNVDRAVRKYGESWLLHAPEETKNYVNSGMLKAYGGGSLPENGSVRPMEPSEIASIMDDPEAARPISDTPIGDEATAQPLEAPDNVISLTDVRKNLDAGKAHDLLAEKLDKAYDYEDAALRGEINMTPDDATANRVIAEKLHDTLPEDHSFREMTSDLVNTWRSIEQTVHELHGQMLPELRDLPDAADEVRYHPDSMKAALKAVTEGELNDNVPVERDTNPPAAGPGNKKPIRQQIKDRTEPPRKSADGHDDMPPPSDEPTVRKMVEAIKAAKPVRNQQKIAISKARAERFQKVAQIYATAEGPAAYRMALKAMKGDMPKADFEGIGHQFDANEIQFLFDKVGKSNRLTPGEKLTGHSGLQKLLATPAGQVPTASELNALSQVFPKELVDGLQKDNKFAHVAAQVLNTPRTIMASFDLSAPLRQGIFLVGRKEFYKAWGPMIKSFASEKAFKALQDEIASRPTFRLMRKADLALTDEGNVLTKREEAFMSNWVEKVPILGKGVRMSSRAYMGFLNKLRADTFDTLIKQAANEGLDLEHDQHALHSIARFINNATGRGDLGRWNTAAPVLNGIFFSPRLIASRVNTLNPVWYATLHPFARRQALKSLLSFSAVALTILGLAKLGGADVEADPRSADFGKIKIGNTRYDILGGYQQFIRSGAQIIAGQTKGDDGEMKSLTTGKFGSKTRLDVAQNFVYNKFSPVPSFVVDWARGKDAVGRKFKLDREVVTRVTPMVSQDAHDLYKDGGLGEVPGVLPGIFGVGVQTYTPRESASAGRPPKSEWDFSSGADNPWSFAKEGEF